MFEECSHYTFETKYGHCVLFEDCESHDETCDTCKTGERNCLAQMGEQTSMTRKLSSLVIVFPT